MTPEFERLRSRIDHLNREILSLFPALTAVRKAYASDRSAENEKALEEIETKVSKLHRESTELVEMLPAASGLPLEMFEQEKAQTPRPATESRRDDTFRENLRADRVETTLEIDELLPTAIAAVESLLPKGWLDEQPRQMTRIHDLVKKDAVLSLTKGVRLASENTPVHRFRQAMHLFRDYMENHPLYDHFAGAMLVPLMVQLARRGSNLAEVGGDRDERLRLLWDGESYQVDSTIFELLTAAASVCCFPTCGFRMLKGVLATLHIASTSSRTARPSQPI